MVGRGRNFDEAEGVQLCRSYLSVAKDPSAPTQGTFWERVVSDFQGARPHGAEERRLRALESKWSEISRDVSAFCRALAQVQTQPYADEQDAIQRACGLYTQTSRGNKPFKHLHCWRILRYEPQWHVAINREAPSSQVIEIESEDDQVDEEHLGMESVDDQYDDEGESDAAVGSKRENSALACIASAVEVIADASMQRARCLEESNQLALFAVNLESLDADAQEFFRRKRARVLRRLQE